MYGLPQTNNSNRLNILELHRKMNQRNEKKSVCYEKILEICHKRIVTQCERDKTTCLFEFPEYVVGYPLFDLNACIKYCEKALIASGFLVKYYFPNKFYISWDFDEIKKHKEEQRKKTPLVAVLPQSQPQQSNTQAIVASPQMHIQQAQPMQQPMQMQQMQQMQQMPHAVPQVQQMQQPNTPVSQVTVTPPYMPQPQQLQQQQPHERTPTFFPLAQPPASILQAKMTAPLPTTLPKYDPFDLYSPSIHSPNTTSNVGGNDGKKASAIDNSFFANSFKQTLTSGIGASKMFNYKPSGKLSLNL